MRLFKVLEVGGDDKKIVADDVQLDLFTPGRAVFVVQSNVVLSGLVRFSLGYDSDNLQRFFVGIVESSMTVDNFQQKIFCREISAVLSDKIPLSLRNVTMVEVLNAINQKTGVDFVVPNEPYTKTKAPAFYSMAGGYHCLDSFADVFSIDQLIWQQQGNGQIFVGSWAHSFWASKSPVNLPVKWKTNHGVNNSARVPVFPRLRPGVMLDDGNIITHVQLDGVHLNIKWSKNPWKMR